jgi:CBS domain-containing protein
MKKLIDVMTKPISTVTPQTPLRKAAALMAEENIGMLPVLENGKVVGTLTDRDVCVQAVARGADPEREPASAVMSPDAVTCDEMMELDKAAKTMQEHRVRRLVVTRKGAPVGMLSLGGLAHASDDPRLVSETLRAVS